MNDAERGEFLFDVLVSAVEGGIDYWAEIKDYEWGSNEGPYKLGWSLPDGERGSYARATVREADDYEVGSWHDLTPATIECGITRLATGNYRLNPEMLDCITEGSTANDAGNIDSLCADAIVQVALLNELVYG